MSKHCRADLVQAGRLHNPVFVFARKTQGSEVEIERLLTLNLAQLITMPTRRMVAVWQLGQAAVEADGHKH